MIQTKIFQILVILFTLTNIISNSPISGRILISDADRRAAEVARSEAEIVKQALREKNLKSIALTEAERAKRERQKKRLRDKAKKLLMLIM